MKNLLKAILVAGLLVSGSSTVSYAAVMQGPFLEGSGNWNLLPNGGFEQGDTSSWVSSWASHLGIIQVTSSYAYSGAYSASLIPKISFEGAGFSLGHPVSVTGGSSYVLSGFFNTSLMTSGQLYLDLNDIAGDISVGSPELELGVDEWQFVWGVTTIPANINTVSVRMVRDGVTVAGEEAFIDEVALTPLADFIPPSQVPVPGSVWLLGSGIAGLVFLRRKRK